jgi:hypothetical protein
MTSSAPRLPWPLIEALPSFDAPGRSIADVWRQACVFAHENGFAQPSYEHIRRLVHRQREIRELPRASDAILEGWLRARSPENAADEAFRRARERRAARDRIRAEKAWRPDVR